MTRDELLALCKEEEAASFKGWDFTRIESPGRMVYNPLSWSYTDIITEKIATAKSLLDMDTGGGEFLSSLPKLPPKAYATECYAPNIPIAKDCLEPLGVTVFGLEDNEHIPLTNKSLDLVINKHGDYSAAELYRLLSHGGTFVTQQVGGKNGEELNQWLGIPNGMEQFSRWNMEFAKNELLSAGFEVVLAQEEFPITSFYDAGAVVYHAKIIEWQFPDFSVERCFENLVKIQEHIDKNGSLDIHSHRFIIVALKK